MVQTSLLLILILVLFGTMALFGFLSQRVGVRQESVEAQLAYYQRLLQAGKISPQKYAAIRQELLH
ncbi:hypothetical protein ACFQ5J_10005 [Lacticaseibacillus baoqingensis]|uniref:SHOCT domain-containing protein n=1 Tax=Lacticaseibacillus baoqingensis TaxID=2486013 RepID=A0ABW4EA47_9LACO|nr:hypothetical protein [Lacticaseibacillus baoqingensis]